MQILRGETQFCSCLSDCTDPDKFFGLCPCLGIWSQICGQLINMQMSRKTDVNASSYVHSRTIYDLMLQLKTPNTGIRDIASLLFSVSWQIEEHLWTQVLNEKLEMYRKIRHPVLRSIKLLLLAARLLSRDFSDFSSCRLTNSLECPVRRTRGSGAYLSCSLCHLVSLFFPNPSHLTHSDISVRAGACAPPPPQKKYLN